MITRKRWTPEEDALLLKKYTDWKTGSPEYTDAQIASRLATDFFTNRTEASIYSRYWSLTSDKGRANNSHKDDQYMSFLDGIEALRMSYDSIVVENQKLRKRIADLEQKEEDFDALTQIMDRARKLAFLGEESATQFKMERNGNLERVK